MGTRLNLLQISTADAGGGAEKIAYNLFESYRERGHNSWLAVGAKRTAHPHIFAMSPGRLRSWWSSFCRTSGKRFSAFDGKVPGLWRLPGLFENPKREIESWFGLEDFNHPASRNVAGLAPFRPDIIHCHNLHGGYFDLGVLPRLTRQAPTVLTLHDAWLMSGHCAHSLDCDRWKTGCGNCPDLTTYPAIQRDATAYNWKRKQKILAGCRLYLATPSQWLMRKVEESIVASAVIEARVIPNGVDISVFKPGNRQTARAALGIDERTCVLLFTANGTRRNRWKDYDTIRTAVAIIADRKNIGNEILLIALGEDGPTERIGQVKLLHIPYQKDPIDVVPYYQAADVYVHAARADTFPNTVIEALACGTPVVATAVGGIPEQVKSLAFDGHGLDVQDLGLFRSDEATGALVPMGDASRMATCIELILTNEPLRKELRANAARDARKRFDLRRQVDSYLSWYEQLIQPVSRSAASNLSRSAASA